MADKIKLTVSMFKKVDVLFDELDVSMIDLSSFVGFEKEVLQVGNVLDSIQIERFANESKKIMTICKNYSAVVLAFMKESGRRLKRVRANALLVESEERWAKKQAREEKPKVLTDTLRKAYVDDSDVVNEAIIVNIKWEAMDKWFTDTMRDLETTHNWYKKLYDKITQNKD